MDGEADGQDEQAGGERSQGGGPEQAATGADGNDDEHDLGAFQHDRLEGGRTGDPVAPRNAPAARVGQARRLLGEGKLLVMQGDDARGAQNSLAEPAQAEQQQKNADDELQVLERHAVYDWPERQHQEPEDTQSGGCTGQCRPPSLHGGDGEDDGEGLDDFDDRGQEGRGYCGSGCRP